MSSIQHSGLVRAIGRWSLAALVINSVVGSGIFGLPSIVAGLLGEWSPWAYLIAAIGNGFIMACFAELASRFSAAGGAYLYAREAMGRFAGIQVGWMAWLVRITSAAANTRLFTDYLGQFWPDVEQPLLQSVVMALLLGLLAAANYRGVRSGANTSNFFTVAKLVPLAIFIISGTIFVLFRHPNAPQSAVNSSAANWFEAVLLLAFGFGGYDAAMMPMGEAKNPQRDAPFALFTALFGLFLIYASIQIIVLRVLPSAASSTRPLADAASIFLGDAGAILMTIGALVSVYGYLSANVLNTPRLTFALAERRDFPRVFAHLHARFRTPTVSILAFVFLVWLLAVIGTFRWNAMVSAVARLFSYGSAVVALLVLRRTRPEAPQFKLPAGNVTAILGLACCVALMTHMGRTEFLIVVGTSLLALVNWLWARTQEERET